MNNEKPRLWTRNFVLIFARRNLDIHTAAEGLTELYERV